MPKSRNRLSKQQEVFDRFPNYQCPENPNRGKGLKSNCSLELLTFDDEKLSQKPIILCQRTCQIKGVRSSESGIMAKST
jgi:hypothetical protein